MSVLLLEPPRHVDRHEQHTIFFKPNVFHKLRISGVGRVILQSLTVDLDGTGTQGLAWGWEKHGANQVQVGEGVAFGVRTIGGDIVNGCGGAVVCATAFFCFMAVGPLIVPRHIHQGHLETLPLIEDAQVVALGAILFAGVNIAHMQGK
jgi:hypothetical protein